MESIMVYLESNIGVAVSFALEVVLAILVFIVGGKVIKWILSLVNTSFEKMEIDKGIQQFANSFLKALLYILLIISIGTKFGLETSSIAALLASAGVAVGLALQGSLSNLAGGVLILLLKPFVVGDYILEDSNKNEGVVKEIQIFYTKLQSVDNRIIVIPNGTLANTSLTNITGQPTRRLDLKISIGYGADLRKAKEIINSMLVNNEHIDHERETFVVVEDLADSAVIIGCKAWVETTEYWAVRWQMLEDIKLRFDEEGIEIPFNQLQVHMTSNAQK